MFFYKIHTQDNRGSGISIPVVVGIHHMQCERVDLSRRQSRVGDRQLIGDDRVSLVTSGRIIEDLIGSILVGEARPAHLDLSRTQDLKE